MSHIDCDLNLDGFDPVRINVPQNKLVSLENQLALFISLFFILCYYTMSARTALWGDSSKLSIYVLNHDYGKQQLTVGAGHHTLTVLIGDLITYLTGLEPANSLAILSVVTGGLSCGLIYKLLCQNCLDIRINRLLTLLFGFAQSNLFIFTIQESYGIMLFMWIALLILATESLKNFTPLKSLLIGVLAGLTFLNHLLPIIISVFTLVPIFILYKSRVQIMKQFVYALFGFLLVIVPVWLFLLMPYKQVTENNQSLLIAVSSNIQAFMKIKTFPKGLLLFLLWIVFQLPIAIVICSICRKNLSLKWNRSFTVHISIILASVCFTAMYMMQRRFLMLTITLPSVMVILSVILSKSGGIISSVYLLPLIPVVNSLIYFGTPLVLEPVIQKMAPELRTNVWRNIGYYINPVSHIFQNPLNLINDIDEKILFDSSSNQKSLILSDFTFIRPLMYQSQAHGWRPDLILEDIDYAFWLEKDARDKYLKSLFKIAKERHYRIVVFPNPDKTIESLNLRKFSRAEDLGSFLILTPY